MKKYSDYIGRIEPATRSASRVDCAECEKAIYDDAFIFVYHDVNGPQPGCGFFMLCEDCHRKPD